MLAGLLVAPEWVAGGMVRIETGVCCGQVNMLSQTMIVEAQGRGKIYHGRVS